MIKGVSDKRRLPRLGKIRLGVKVEGQKSKYPKAMDYFVCPPEVQKVYGEKPKSLDIMFPVEDENIFFQQFYKRYSKSGLVCKGDGETAVKLDRETGELQEISCDPNECEWYNKKHCRMLASLQFMLPKVPGVGVYQIDTSSYHSIVNINSTIEMVRAVCGRIRMIPLRLELVPQEVQPEGFKKTVYVMNLVAPYTLPELLSLKKKESEFLLPPINEDERPEELYPDEIINDREQGRRPEEIFGGYDEEASKEAFNGFIGEEVEKDNPFDDATGKAEDSVHAGGNVQDEAPPEEFGNSGEENNENDSKQEPPQAEWKRGRWYVRVADRPPVRPTKVNGKSAYIFKVERRTKKGTIKGQLIVPQKKIEITKVNVGTIFDVAGIATISGKGFVIVANDNIRQNTQQAV